MARARRVYLTLRSIKNFKVAKFHFSFLKHFSQYRVMARNKIPSASDLDIDITKAIIINELAVKERATSQELKRAVENVLISANKGVLKKELSELESKQYIKSELNELGDVVYFLTNKGLKYAKSKTIQNILDMIS